MLLSTIGHHFIFQFLGVKHDGFALLISQSAVLMRETDELFAYSHQFNHFFPHDAPSLMETRRKLERYTTGETAGGPSHLPGYEWLPQSERSSSSGY